MLKVAEEILLKAQHAIAINLVQCILYGEDPKSYSVWVKDLAEQFYRIDRSTIRDIQRFKPLHYEEQLFGLFGYTIQETYAGIKYVMGSSDWQYSAHDILYIDVENLYEVIIRLRSRVCRMLSENGYHTKNDFAALIHSELDFYCLD